jgi:hypothetical protein
MASQPDVALLRRQQAGISSLVLRDLNGFWSTLDLSKPEKARDMLLVYGPAMVETYGEASASVAADWYDAERARAKIRGRFRASAAAPVDAEIVTARTRFGVGHLFSDNPDQTLAFLSGALEKYALQPARDTVAASSVRDPAARGWQRITNGGCDFCDMLAGRGAVYSEATVSFEAHGHCRCAAAPAWS